MNQPYSEQMILVKSENEEEEQLPSFPKEACHQYQCGHTEFGVPVDHSTANDQLGTQILGPGAQQRRSTLNAVMWRSPLGQN